LVLKLFLQIGKPEGGASARSCWGVAALRPGRLALRFLRRFPAYCATPSHVALPVAGDIDYHIEDTVAQHRTSRPPTSELRRIRLPPAAGMSPPTLSAADGGMHRGIGGTPSAIRPRWGLRRGVAPAMLLASGLGRLREPSAAWPRANACLTPVRINPPKSAIGFRRKSRHFDVRNVVRKKNRLDIRSMLCSRRKAGRVFR